MASETKFQIGLSQKQFVKFNISFVLNNKILWAIMAIFLLLYIMVFIAYYDIHIYQSYIVALIPLMLLFMFISISSFQCARLEYEDLSNLTYFIDSTGIGYNNPNGRNFFIPWCDISLIKEDDCFYKFYKKRILLLKIHRTGLNSDIRKIIHELFAVVPVPDKRLLNH